MTGLLWLWVLACEYAALLARLVLPHSGRRVRRQWPSLTPWPMTATDPYLAAADPLKDAS